MTNVRANVWFDALDARSRGRVMAAPRTPSPIHTS
jgi:hypothetical protein